MFVNESQIRALIRLLGDEDERIVKTISGRLIDFGDSAVPLLQEAEIEQPEMADRIVTVLEEIRGTRLEEELRDLVAFPDEQVDLETGAFILARYAYPMLDVRGYQGQLDRMAQDVREQIGSRVSGEETVKALNRYLFTEAGFKGNTKKLLRGREQLSQLCDRPSNRNSHQSLHGLPSPGPAVTVAGVWHRHARALSRQVRFRKVQDLHRLF